MKKKNRSFRGTKMRFVSVGRIRERPGAFGPFRVCPLSVSRLSVVLQTPRQQERGLLPPTGDGVRSLVRSRASAPTALTVAGHGPGGHLSLSHVAWP